MKHDLKKICKHLVYALKQDILQEIGQLYSDSENHDNDLDLPMTSKEVCSFYKISPSTLERYVRKGLKYSSSGRGTKRLFSKRQVEKYLKK